MPAEALESIRLGLTAILAVYLSMALELSTPEWAGWTVLSVSLSTRASSLQKSLWRAIGSVVGAAIALLLLACFAQATLAFDLALALWLGALTALSSLERGQRSYGFALAGFTVPIIALAVLDQPGRGFSVAVDRCSTLLLGIACAHASSVLVARSVGTVSHALAERIDATALACADWLAETRHRAADDPVVLPPIGTIIALDGAIAEALIEQSSLRTGGRFITNAPNRLLLLGAEGLLMRFLPPRSEGGGDRVAAARLFDCPVRDGPRFGWQARLAVAGRLLLEGRRIGSAYAPVQSLAADRDGRNARNNGVRTAVAIGLVSGFWFLSEWPSGATAVTWTGLLCSLLAARANSAEAARSFMLGAALAAVVGLTVHYTALTVSGHFLLLAAVILPIAMMAALGRADKRAALGAGYGMYVLNACSLHNAMRYDLAADLNTTVAALSGMAVAVAAFNALPPPASAATLRRRARQRMANGFRAAALDPALLSPSPESWLARMAARLDMLRTEDQTVITGGVALLLMGRLLLAIGNGDAALRREAGRLAWNGAPGGLASLADRPDLDPMQRHRIRLIAALRTDPGLTGWPGLPPIGDAPATIRE